CVARLWQSVQRSRALCARANFGARPSGGPRAFGGVRSRDYRRAFSVAGAPLLALFLSLVLVTALTRLFELQISRRHRRALLAQGAKMAPDPGFQQMV